MENFTQNNQENKQFGLGVLILIIGAVFLLRNTGLAIPHWILSWHTAMLAVGLWLGYRKNFQGGSWLAIAIIGGIFTLKDISLFDIDLSRFTTAMILIALGTYLILKPKKFKSLDHFRQAQAPEKDSINF